MQDKITSVEEAGKLIPKSATPPSSYGEADAPIGYFGRSDGGTEAASLYEVLRVLRKHKWRVLAIVSAFGVIGLLRTLMMTPLYTATVRVQIDRNVAKVVESGNIAPLESFDFEFLRTQYELLQGAAVAERVASTLRLGDDQSFLNQGGGGVIGFVFSLLSVGSRGNVLSDRAAQERAAAGIVLANRTIRPLSGSRLVDISYTDPVPARAQMIAGGLAQAFIDLNLDKRFQVNAYAKSFLEDQIKQLQIRLQDSEKALVDFGEREQIITTNEKSSIAESNLSAGNAALGALVAERIRNEQLYKQVESVKAINLPQFLANKAIEGLREKRNMLVAEYQEKLETFKPSYPSMIQINNRIREIDHQIDVEVKAIKDALKGAYEASLNQENEMKARIEVLRSEVLDLQKRSIQYNILKREVDTNRSLYESLLQRYKEIDVASGAGANNVFVVERADLPKSPSSPQLARNLFLSLFLGVIAAMMVVFVLERFDDTVGSAEELERVTGLATLGLIPQVGSDTTIDRELADLRSGVSEAYRTLCTSLHFATDSGLPKNLLVTSSAMSEGKSTTALAIARHFATLGLKVLIIDADLRRPSLHTKLGLDNEIGLSNYLTGACSPPKAMQNTSTNNLVFMSSGPIPPNPADLLASSRFMTLLSIGGEVFDFIVVDSPPVLGLADAQLLANVAAATIFVIRAGGTRKAQLRDSLKRLRFARANVIGGVLTRQDTKTAGYGYGYGYGYNYGYGYGEDGGHTQISGSESRKELADERSTA
jgi:succinoglycan biosynthesis transport protein ExoP